MDRFGDNFTRAGWAEWPLTTTDSPRQRRRGVNRLRVENATGNSTRKGRDRAQWGVEKIMRNVGRGKFGGAIWQGFVPRAKRSRCVQLAM